MIHYAFYFVTSGQKLCGQETILGPSPDASRHALKAHWMPLPIRTLLSTCPPRPASCDMSPLPTYIQFSFLSATINRFVILRCVGLNAEMSKRLI
jgi:hypothetical protein